MVIEEFDLLFIDKTNQEGRRKLKMTINAICITRLNIFIGPCKLT